MLVYLESGLIRVFKILEVSLLSILNLKLQISLAQLH